jgi:hypothetical protein
MDVLEPHERDQVCDVGPGEREDQPDPNGIVPGTPQGDMPQSQPTGTGDLEKRIFQSRKVLCGRTQHDLPGPLGRIENSDGGCEFSRQPLGHLAEHSRGIPSFRSHQFSSGRHGLHLWIPDSSHLVALGLQYLLIQLNSRTQIDQQVSRPTNRTIGMVATQ